MNRKQIISAILCAAALLSLCGCGANSAAAEEPAVSGVAVETQTVRTRAISADSTVSGVVSAQDESMVMVAVTAKCLETYVEAGDTVTEGQALCKLDLASTLSSYNAAKLAYNAARQSYNDQAATFNQQISAASQSVSLYEKVLSDTEALYAIGAASQMEIDQASLQLSSARSQLQSAIAGRNSTLSQLETSIQSSLSNVQQFETALENIGDDGMVLAPTGGLLVTMNATKEGYVSSSMPVAVINSTGRMDVTVQVSETLIPKLHIGDTADVTVAALGSSFPAAIRAVDQAASAMTKLYHVTLTVPEGVPGLLSGMFAEVTFHTDSIENAIVIPSEAILTSGTIQYVYVVEDGLARYIEVTAGMTGDGVTEITSGLAEGQALVTVGQSYLSDDDAVRVVREG